MGVAKTFATVTALLVVVLMVSLRAEGQSYCRRVFRRMLFTEHFEDDVNCTGWSLHMRCLGSCGSNAIVEQKGSAVHWKQDCECCQSVGGYQAAPIAIEMNCTDDSTRLFNTTFIIPRYCQCTDC